MWSQVLAHRSSQKRAEQQRSWCTHANTHTCEPGSYPGCPLIPNPLGSTSSTLCQLYSTQSHLSQSQLGDLLLPDWTEVTVGIFLTVD